ncbi:hypothetical protein R3P38DRAFT_3180083 [Favolaschia claudopus]|uniref:Uncharacterized protein n=1 Tax=Favolaschia claudopus TaxID=2862362 RepID=A0AAW0CRJ9_9AGAR
MLRTDIDEEAQTFKVLYIHLFAVPVVTEFLRILPCKPMSASSRVFRFELRFNGATVKELKRTGVYGSQVINPSEVKLGLEPKLGEGVLLFIKGYLAKLGINEWAVDFTQSPYSIYNTAMRICAVDTFRFLVGVFKFTRYELEG